MANLLLTNAVPDGETCEGCMSLYQTSPGDTWSCVRFYSHGKNPHPACLAARAAAKALADLDTPEVRALVEKIVAERMKDLLARIERLEARPSTLRPPASGLPKCWR